MPENEIEYTHESYCEVCDKTLMGSGDPSDFTMSVEAKRQAQEAAGETDEAYEDGYFEHECQFTEHYVYDEPIVRTIEY